MSPISTRWRAPSAGPSTTSFAHELCHALFDGTKLSHFGLLESRSDLHEACEQRANAFAAHFLAPPEAVLRFLQDRGLREGDKPAAVHVRTLSEHFGMGDDWRALLEEQQVTGDGEHRSAL